MAVKSRPLPAINRRDDNGNVLRVGTETGKAMLFLRALKKEACIGTLSHVGLHGELMLEKRLSKTDHFYRNDQAWAFCAMLLDALPPETLVKIRTDTKVYTSSVAKMLAAGTRGQHAEKGYELQHFVPVSIFESTDVR